MPKVQRTVEGSKVESEDTIASRSARTRFAEKTLSGNARGSTTMMCDVQTVRPVRQVANDMLDGNRSRNMIVDRNYDDVSPHERFARVAL